MSAQINDTWSVDRWARTMLHLHRSGPGGKQEVDRRTKDLPIEFRKKIIARIKELIASKGK